MSKRKEAVRHQVTRKGKTFMRAKGAAKPEKTPKGKGKSKEKTKEKPKKPKTDVSLADEVEKKDAESLENWREAITTGSAEEKRKLMKHALQMEDDHPKKIELLSIIVEGQVSGLEEKAKVETEGVEEAKKLIELTEDLEELKEIYDDLEDLPVSNDAKTDLKLLIKERVDEINKTEDDEDREDYDEQTSVYTKLNSEIEKRDDAKGLSEVSKMINSAKMTTVLKTELRDKIRKKKKSIEKEGKKKEETND